METREEGWRHTSVRTTQGLPERVHLEQMQSMLVEQSPNEEGLEGIREAFQNGSRKVEKRRTTATQPGL
jgi:hypothetical protein